MRNLDRAFGKGESPKPLLFDVDLNIYIVEIMQQLAKEQGCTNLLVTHDRRILDIADRIIQMEDGKLAKDMALVGNQLVERRSGSSVQWLIVNGQRFIRSQ